MEEEEVVVMVEEVVDEALEAEVVVDLMKAHQLKYVVCLLNFSLFVDTLSNNGILL